MLHTTTRSAFQAKTEMPSSTFPNLIEDTDSLLWQDFIQALNPKILTSPGGGQTNLFLFIFQFSLALLIRRALMVLGASQARRTLLASHAGRAVRRTACPFLPRPTGRQEGRLPPAASPAAGQRRLCRPRAAGGCGTALRPGTASSSPPCSPKAGQCSGLQRRTCLGPPLPADTALQAARDGTAEHSLVQPRVCKDVSASNFDTPMRNAALRPLESRW